MPVSEADDDEWAEFFRRWHPAMVDMARKLGASQPDAEDAASAVTENVRRSWTSWTEVQNKDKRCYLHTCVRNELVRTGKGEVARQEREARWSRESRCFEPRDAVTAGHDHRCELDDIRQFLAISPKRQREVLYRLYLWRELGWKVKEAADALGITPDTIRRHRQNACELWTPYLTENDHESRRWLRAGERAHEDFHRGQSSPFQPRPIIAAAWTLARNCGLDPQRGTSIVLLDSGELRERREHSPVPAGSPSLAELVDLATRNELLAVVLDEDNIVLHRGGPSAAMHAADQLGFVDGARWDLANAGITAAGLARLLGRAATVSRWEHTFPDQHRLCCLAVPVRTPHGGHLTLNLTATTDSVTSVPRALRRQLHTVAQRLHRQLWTPTTRN